MAKKILTALDFQKNEIQNAVIQNLGSAPATPSNGQIFYLTSGGHDVQARVNGAWVSLIPSSLLGTANVWTANQTINANILGNGTIALTGAGASSVGGTLSATAHIASGLTGAVAASRYVGATASGAPASGTFLTGDYVIDQTGTMWICTAGGTSGTWVRPAGYLLGLANTWSASNTFSGGIVANSAITGNGTIALTGSGASSVGGNFSAVINVSTGLTGATAASRYVGATASGSPASGTFAVGDFVIAQNGHIFICTSAGTPGTWADVAGAGITPASSVVADNTFGASSVVGTSTNYARQDHSHGSPTHIGTDHSAISLSSLSAPTADLSIGTHKLTNVTDPTNPQDAATKNYVDAVSQGVTGIKNPVRAATTANGTLATAYANGQVIDGVTLATGDRILIKNQTTPSENGIYTVNASGAPTRSTDADASGEIGLGTLTYVTTGTSNGGQQWIVTAVGATPWVPGSSSSTWTMYFAATATQAGAGLTATGNVFAVGAGTGISVAADSVAVDTTVVARKFTQQIGNGALTSIAVTHGLGNQWCNVQVFSTSSPFDEELCDIQLTDANTVTLLFSTAPATNALRVVVTG